MVADSTLFGTKKIFTFENFGTKDVPSIGKEAITFLSDLIAVPRLVLPQ